MEATAKSPNEKPLLTRPEAAEFLVRHGYPTTKGTLQKIACIGGGPTFRKFGPRALYTPTDLLTWAQSRCSPPMPSTTLNPGRSGNDDVII